MVRPNFVGISEHNLRKGRRKAVKHIECNLREGRKDVAKVLFIPAKVVTNQPNLPSARKLRGVWEIINTDQPNLPSVRRHQGVRELLHSDQPNLP